MSSVFLVSSGEYSDYRVVAVFSTGKLAQAFIERCDADQKGNDCYYPHWNNVREMALDFPIPAEGYSVWKVTMGVTSGMSSSTREELVDCFDEDENAAPSIGFAFHKPFDGEMCATCTVVATDEDHAIKIANERRLKMIATGQLDKIKAELDARRKRS